MSRITASARDQPCEIRIPGHCCHDNSTVVHCHLDGAGWALKNNDLLGARGCHICHGIVGGHIKTDIPPETIKLYFYEAIFRTIKALIKEGLVGLE